MLLLEEDVVLLHRSQAAQYNFYQIHNVEDRVDELTAEEFLDYREIMADRSHIPSEKKLLIDFKPFYSTGPEIPEPKKIGSGHRYLNSYMAGKLQEEPEDWHAFLCEFLKTHSIDNNQILVDGEIIKDSTALMEALQKAIASLELLDEKAPIHEARATLDSLGIREGFGDTVERSLTNLRLLFNLFESPSADYLDEFLGSIPLISRIAVISPHGWFGQDHVLGRPDTGGQVVYSGNGLIGYGELIIIKHSEKMLSAYAHNKKRLVKEGDQVSSGQKIAEMGRNSGNEQLLHFEIRVNGKPVNPLTYLPKK